MHLSLPDQISAYCTEASSPEPAWLQELVRYTWQNTVNPRQLSGHLQGRFLSFLSQSFQPQTILEIGTFTGYSALCLAEGLAADGHLHTIEADAEIAFKARNFIVNTPFKNKITVHEGDALQVIPQLNLSPNLIFIDAEKQNYRRYAELCIPLLKPGGIMLFDNTLWSLKVLSEQERSNDADTRYIHQFNAWLRQLENMFVVQLPLRDGLTMLRKK